VRPKRELLRLVRTPQGVVCVDTTGKLAGRGAYLCRNEHCAERAVKQKKLNRALGVSLSQEVTETITRLCGTRDPEACRTAGDQATNR
jgi:predicted RNA-binding protein YlxR (DUF448 family)